MSYKIIHNAKDQIIEVKTLGEMRTYEIDQLIKDITQAIKDNNCFLVLSDYRESLLIQELLEIYDFPQKIADALKEAGISMYKVKRAIVVAHDKDKYRFYETVAVNRRHYLKMFTDIDEAKKWLLQNNKD